MKYSLTFREVRPAEQLERVDMIVMNAVAWPQLEYQIPDALGPNSTHVHVRRAPIALSLILHSMHCYAELQSGKNLTETSCCPIHSDKVCYQWLRN